MSSRIKYLSFLIVLLSLAIFFALRHTDGNGSGQDGGTAEANFAIADTSKIDKLVLGDQVLEKTQKEGWMLNNQLKVDEQMMVSLLSLMQQMEIKRPITTEGREAVMNVFALNGLEVRVYEGDLLKQSYLLAGDEGETYVMAETSENSALYSVYIPGYFIKLRPLFDISPESWRDKTLLKLNWRTLKNFTIDYPKTPERNLNIYFEEDFYNVEGVNALDSAKLYYYITDVARFKAESFLNDPDLRDSLQELTPFCALSMRDIRMETPQRLLVYTIEPNIYGILEPQKQLVRLNPRALGNFLATPQDFEKK